MAGAFFPEYRGQQGLFTCIHYWISLEPHGIRGGTITLSQKMQEFREVASGDSVSRLQESSLESMLSKLWLHKSGFCFSKYSFIETQFIVIFCLVYCLGLLSHYKGRVE